MEQFHIEWSNQAKTDIRKILNYIKNIDGYNRAVYVRKGIDKAVRNLAIFPNKHRIEPIFNRKDVRFTVKWKLKIIFQISNNTIRILSVFHTAQDPDKITQIKM